MSKKKPSEMETAELAAVIGVTLAVSIYRVRALRRAAKSGDTAQAIATGVMMLLAARQNERVVEMIDELTNRLTKK